MALQPSKLCVGYVLLFLSNTKHTVGNAAHSPQSTAGYQNELSYTSTSACLRNRHSNDIAFTNVDVLLTVHLSILISVINQLDAQNFCFTISLFHASTCFEHMCSSSGDQNCITQPLVSLTYGCDDTRGCVMQF